MGLAIDSLPTFFLAWALLSSFHIWDSLPAFFFTWALLSFLHTWDSLPAFFLAWVLLSFFHILYAENIVSSYICHPWTYDVDIERNYDSGRKKHWPEDEWRVSFRDFNLRLRA